MSAAIANFRVKSGEAVSDINFNFGTDTTGQRARMEIRAYAGGPLIQAFDTSDATLTNTNSGYHPAVGQRATVVASTATYQYELWTVDTLGEPHDQAQGTWTIEASVMQGL